MPDATPPACRPGALSAEENRLRSRLFATLRAAAVEERSTDRRLSWTLRRSDEVLAAATRLVALEARCCPFLAFELRVPPGDAPFVLTVNGPAGTRAMLRAELGA